MVAQVGSLNCLAIACFAADNVLEEEKKALLSMLSKLYITSNSNAEKLRIVHELVLEAVDLKIATDAPTRNGLIKLEAALVKVIGESGVSKRNTEGETIAALAQEDLTTVDEEQSELQVAPCDGTDDTKMNQTKHGEDEEMGPVHDTLLEELLTDEDEDA